LAGAIVPEVLEPVVPLVPELLLVEDGDVVVDGVVVVVVEPPEAPMPDVEVELLPGVDIEPLAAATLEPMPEAVPDVVPVALHAASAATHAAVRITFIMNHSCLDVENMPAREARRT